MCIEPRDRGRQYLGVKILIPTERLYHFDHLLQVSKTFLPALILYIFLYYFIHVFSHGSKFGVTLPKILMSAERPYHFYHLLQVLKQNHFEVGFYIYFLMFSCMYIAPGQEQTTPWRKSFHVKRKPRSLWPFVASFKMVSLNSDFIHSF